MLSTAWAPCASTVEVANSLLTTLAPQLPQALHEYPLVALCPAEPRYPQCLRPLTARIRPSSPAAHRGLFRPQGSEMLVLAALSLEMVALPCRLFQGRLQLVLALRQRAARVLLRALGTLQRYRPRRVAIQVLQVFQTWYMRWGVALKRISAVVDAK